MQPLLYGPFVAYKPGLPLRDLSPQDVGVCTNVFVNDGHVESTPGWAAMDDGGVIVDNVLHVVGHVTTTGIRFTCIHTAQHFVVYSHAGGTFINYSKGTGYSTSTRWTSCSYGRYYIFTNGVDPIQLWDSEAGTLVDAVDLSVSAPIAKIVMAFGAYLLAANTNTVTEGPFEIKWSTSSDITVWSGGDSGSRLVYEGGGEILSLMMLTRDTVVVYKTGSLHTLSYAGYPYYFVDVSMVVGVGPVSSRAVARWDNSHIIMSTRGLVSYDGVSLSDMAPEIIPLYDSMMVLPADVRRHSQIVTDQPRRRLWVMIPTDTSGVFTQALVYEIADKSWHLENIFSVFSVGMGEYSAADVTIDAVSATVDDTVRLIDATQAKPAMFLGGAGKLLLADSGLFTRDGVAYYGVMQTGLRNPGAELFQRPLNKSELVQLDLDIVSGTPQVYVGVTDTPGGTITWTYAGVPVNGRIQCTHVGRWFVFKLQSQTQYKIGGFAAYFVPRGVY